ncbi:MAG: ATP-dependent 6-phosphofructokinase [Nitrospirae bacterium]|nr:ATP-dependent 6-phosphofructokinase [Nitrospirota bacterium]
MIDSDFNIKKLGECRIPSPMTGINFIDDTKRVLYDDELDEIKAYLNTGKEPPSFEMAGPKEKVYFDPSKLKCGIVTCGGLCPGLNDVIRSITMSLHNHYGVRNIFGFLYGYEGLIPKYKHEHVELTPEEVGRIHKMGGTFLSSSRGRQDVSQMVDTLERMNINVLFTIGGDGTLQGAHAIAKEIEKRGLKISVIGVPKTIDNDISFIQTTFGFETAVTEARRSTYSAHSEATGARNGIGLVKLMGRDSGFIAAYAALADTQVNFCLIPEAPFTLEGFLPALEKRIDQKGHAVIVAAEGAGQDIMECTGKKDASGNVRYSDIGLFLKDNINAYFNKKEKEINLKYIDPSYTIRSIPATAKDSAFCLLLGQNAVHAAMTGRTDMVVGYWKNVFTHVPIPLAVSARKKIDPEGWLWNAVIASTGQTREML